MTTINPTPPEPAAVSAPARPYREIVAGNIRAQAAKAGITSMAELGRRLNEERGWVRRRWAGTHEISTDEIERIAQAIGCPINKLTDTDAA